MKSSKVGNAAPAAGHRPSSLGLVCRYAALLLVAAGHAALGQSRAVLGRVHISGDSARMIVGAEVALLPTLRVTRSDSAGQFRFDGVPSGTYTVRVRHIGFDVSLNRVEVASTDVAVDATLRVDPQALGQVRRRTSTMRAP